MNFDCQLLLKDAVHELVVEANWKLRTLVRSRRYFTGAQLVQLYKANLLSYLEYRTAALYHAASSTLEPLDRLQTRFLREAGVSELEGLMVFNLAPLSARRDMAMLGLIHRTVLGKGPPQFREFFKPAETQENHPATRLFERRHGKQLKEWKDGTHTDVVTNSALGLVTVYNLLPDYLVQKPNVKDFQRSLQALLKQRAAANCEDWTETFSPRLPLWRHPLRQ